jgi:hypothetical protein
MLNSSRSVAPRLALYGKKFSDAEEELRGIKVDKKKKKSKSGKSNSDGLDISPVTEASNDTTQPSSSMPPDVKLTPIEEKMAEFAESTSVAQSSISKEDAFREQFQKYRPREATRERRPRITEEEVMANVKPSPMAQLQNLESTPLSMQSELPANPFSGGTIPPEILFFGDARSPPPPEAGRDPRYHLRLLKWARHAHVAPITGKDRLESVFLKGRLHPLAPKVSRLRT